MLYIFQCHDSIFHPLLEYLSNYRVENTFRIRWNKYFFVFGIWHCMRGYLKMTWYEFYLQTWIAFVYLVNRYRNKWNQIKKKDLCINKPTKIWNLTPCKLIKNKYIQDTIHSHPTTQFQRPTQHSALIKENRDNIFSQTNSNFRTRFCSGNNFAFNKTKTVILYRVSLLLIKKLKKSHRPITCFRYKNSMFLL